MAEFTPRHLSKKEVAKVFDDYLASLEVSQLQEHLRLLVGDHLDENGQIELDDSHALVDRLVAERDRLVKLAKKGK